MDYALVLIWNSVLHGMYKTHCLIMPTVMDPITKMEVAHIARTYVQLPLWQWGSGNVYLLVLSSWKVNITENPIAVMGL